MPFATAALPGRRRQARPRRGCYGPRRARRPPAAPAFSASRHVHSCSRAAIR
jgi:hypothetical protein